MKQIQLKTITQYIRLIYSHHGYKAARSTLEKKIIITFFMILEFTYNVHLRSITITDTLKEILDRNQNCTTRYTIIIFLVCDT